MIKISMWKGPSSFDDLNFSIGPFTATQISEIVENQKSRQVRYKTEQRGTYCKKNRMGEILQILDICFIDLVVFLKFCKLPWYPWLIKKKIIIIYLFMYIYAKALTH